MSKLLDSSIYCVAWYVANSRILTCVRGASLLYIHGISLLWYDTGADCIQSVHLCSAQQHSKASPSRANVHCWPYALAAATAAVRATLQTLLAVGYCSAL